MNIFSLAAQNANLLPNQRAMLKFVEGVILSVVLAGVTAVLPLLTSNTASIDWRQVATVGVTAMLATLYNTVKKSLTAPTDPPLAPALSIPPLPASDAPVSPSYAAPQSAMVTVAPSITVPIASVDVPPLDVPQAPLSSIATITPITSASDTPSAA